LVISRPTISLRDTEIVTHLLCIHQYDYGILDMKVAVFTKNKTNPAYYGARIAADRAAAIHGVQVDHYVPDTPDDPHEQSAMIRQALSRGYDAFVMSPVHPTRVDEALKEISAANIPIISVVSPVTSVPCHTFVTSDDYELGVMIARHLFTHLNGRGNVLVVSGHVDSTTSLDRMRGFHDAAAEYPAVTLVDTIVGDYIQPVAYSRTQAWLAQHLDTRIDGCLVANDIMAIGVIAAMKEQGRHPVVVGVNAIPEAIPALRDGSMLATADFNALRLAYLATDAAVHVLKGGTLPARISLPVQIVTKENCHLWDLPYEQRSVLTLEDVLGKGLSTDK
jgi:ribose transport system substrate-binding protein